MVAVAAALAVVVAAVVVAAGQGYRWGTCRRRWPAKGGQRRVLLLMLRTLRKRPAVRSSP